MEAELVSVFNKYWHAIVAKLPAILLAAAVLFVFIFVGKKAGRITSKRLSVKSHDKLVSDFAGRVVKYVFIVLGFFISMNILGYTILAGSLLTGAGISAAIFGFAFKNIGENILAGFLLAFNRPFKVGDLIMINGMTGNITSVDFRSTNIKTSDGEDIFIPNSMIITNPLTNYTYDSKRRFSFLIMIDYSYDVHKIKKLVLEAINMSPEVLAEPQPLVIIDQLSSNINIKALFWIDSDISVRNILIIKSEIMENSKNLLQKNGFNISNTSQINITNESIDVNVKS
ncbi:MAG: hypothetical protein HGGPFJEG_01802 [Ignavibacteria bacterium]|nr:hypothetical protein [Ignavibacteria bacterium]